MAKATKTASGMTEEQRKKEERLQTRIIAQMRRQARLGLRY